MPNLQFNYNIDTIKIIQKLQQYQIKYKITIKTPTNEKITK